MPSLSPPQTHTEPLPASPRLTGWQRLACWALSLAAIGGVFMLYVQPDFMVLMANQVWACF